MTCLFFQKPNQKFFFFFSPNPCNVPNFQVVAGIWDLANHLENAISGTDWIKRISEHIKQITGGKVDLDNRESNSQWVKMVLGKLDFNLGRHCWVTYSEWDEQFSYHGGKSCLLQVEAEEKPRRGVAAEPASSAK